MLFVRAGGGCVLQSILLVCRNQKRKGRYLFSFYFKKKKLALRNAFLNHKRIQDGRDTGPNNPPGNT